jgi:aldose 1-epimerase
MLPSSARGQSTASDPPTVLEISNDRFRLGLAPALGGSIVHLTWMTEGRPDIDLMRRGSAEDLASGNPSRLASFVMVPFANRIDAGRIPLASPAEVGASVQVPVTRPAQNVAIHGFGRLAQWHVSEAVASGLKLTQSFHEVGNPYRYDAEQHFELLPDRVICSVRVTNTGAELLPFGIGFHPWFDRTPRSTLTLGATQAFTMDERDMPLAAASMQTIFSASPTDGEHTMAIERQTPFDTPLSGWSGRAVVTWPERSLELTLTGGGAFKLVHIFSPASPAVFCVEPVSHMPDVVNRRHLASHGDMAVLVPGGALAGSMALTPRFLP